MWRTDNVVFFKAFLRNWRAVGSPWQSSYHVARNICSSIDFRTAQRIVEIGPGLGRITKEILRSLRPDGLLIVFELDSELCRSLEALGDPRLVVHNVSGLEMRKVFRGKADHVVCEIPIANLSPQMQDRLYTEVKNVLCEAGSYIQLQLSLLSYRKVRQFFHNVTVRFVLLNPPPVFIYHCTNREVGSARPLRRAG